MAGPEKFARQLLPMGQVARISVLSMYLTNVSDLDFDTWAIALISGGFQYRYRMLKSSTLMSYALPDTELNRAKSAKLADGCPAVKVRATLEP